MAEPARGGLVICKGAKVLRSAFSMEAGVQRFYSGAVLHIQPPDRRTEKSPSATTGLFRVIENYTARVTLPLRRQRVQT